MPGRFGTCQGMINAYLFLRIFLSALFTTHGGVPVGEGMKFLVKSFNEKIFSAMSSDNKYHRKEWNFRIFLIISRFEKYTRWISVQLYDQKSSYPGNHSYLPVINNNSGNHLVNFLKYQNDFCGGKVRFSIIFKTTDADIERIWSYGNKSPHKNTPPGTVKF